MAKGEPFDLDLTADRTVRLLGKATIPVSDEDYWYFNSLRSNSLAWAFIEAALTHLSLQYIVCVNGIIFAFKTPFGWSFIPMSNYSHGRLPIGFKADHETAVAVYNQILSAEDDG